MAQFTEPELKLQELEIRRQELVFQRAKLFIEFAKYGFAGTLTAVIVGMVMVFGLACLTAFTTFKIDGFALLGIMFILLIGSVAFGFLSLWELPRIVARFARMELGVNNKGTAEEATTPGRADRTLPGPH